MLKQRRYDVDTIRAMALLLLIFYHGAVAFQSFGWSLYFISNKDTIEELWLIMAAINTWRIPILFLIAGIALRFSFENRTRKELFKERAKVLLIPLCFGILTAAYLVILIPTLYKGEKFWYFPIFQGAHLWFLYNIFLYSVICIPLLPWLSNKKRSSPLPTKILGLRGGIFLFALPLALEGGLLDILGKASFYGHQYEGYVNSLHGWVLGFLWFVIGIVLASQEGVFWKSNKRNLPIHGALALILYLFRLLNELEAPNILIAFESFNFIFAVLGVGAYYFNRASKPLDYFKEAVFPIYIVHLPIQQFLMFHLVDKKIPALPKYLLLVVLTLLLSFVFFEIVRRIGIIRPLFGLKNKMRKFQKLRILT